MNDSRDTGVTNGGSGGAKGAVAGATQQYVFD